MTSNIFPASTQRRTALEILNVTPLDYTSGHFLTDASPEAAKINAAIVLARRVSGRHDSRVQPFLLCMVCFLMRLRSPLHWQSRLLQLSTPCLDAMRNTVPTRPKVWCPSVRCRHTPILSTTTVAHSHVKPRFGMGNCAPSTWWHFHGRGG